MKIDYNIFYKDELSISERWNYQPDIFISAYNLSDRVSKCFDEVQTKSKYWIVFPEYQFTKNELPSEHLIECVKTEEHFTEADFISIISQHQLGKLIENNSLSLCIDITGFIKPYMMTLIVWLARYCGRKSIDIIFSEPDQYANKSKTKFSGEDISNVRQVFGCEGKLHSAGSNDELLIIGSGYDHVLIAGVAEKKNSAKTKIQIFGFPSLRADMYQENILRASCVSDSIGGSINGQNPLNYLAPANDPFATASVLQRIFIERSIKDNTSCYLCPLATKTQALGFILFFLNECMNKPISIIYPICKTHKKKTSKGISRIWKYTLEFPGLT